MAFLKIVINYTLDNDKRIEEIKCIHCSQKWSEIVAYSKKRQLCGSVLANNIEYLLPNDRIPLVPEVRQLYFLTPAFY